MNPTDLRSLITLTAFLFSATANAAVNGLVMNREGVPIEGARIEVHALETSQSRIDRWFSESPGRMPLATTETDAKGRFAASKIAGGPVWQIAVHAPGYAPSMTRVVDGEDLGAIALSRVETVTGRIVDPKGQGVSGAKVMVAATDESEVIATTDETGRYPVPNPKGWATSLIVIHPEFATLEDGAPMRAPSPNQKLERGVTVEGKIIGPEERPVPSAKIRIDGRPAGISDEAGTFRIERVPVNWRMLEASTGTLHGSSGRSGPSTSIVIRLSDPTVISGRVIVEPARRPLAGATVTLVQPMGTGPSVERSVITDASGVWSITGVRPGRHQAMIQHPAAVAAATPVQAKAGETARYEISAMATAWLEGIVVGEGEEAIAAAIVRVDEPMSPLNLIRFIQPAQAWSAPDGRFVVRGATPGVSLSLVGSKPGLPTAKEGPLELDPAEHRRGILLRIPLGILVEGIVMSSAGDPIEGVEVVAQPSQADDFSRRIVNRMRARFPGEKEDTIRTDREGGFSLRLIEGRHDFTFTVAGFAMGRVNAHEVRPGGEPLEITLQPGVALAGEVVRGGAPVEGVMVSLTSQQQPMFEPVTTGADGRFRFEGLSAGAGMLTALKRDEMAYETRSVKIPSEDVRIELPLTGTVRGRVYEADSRVPVRSFRLGPSGDRDGGSMMIRMMPNLRSFDSDDGSFVLENVPAGALTLLIEADGYTPRTIANLEVGEGAVLDNIEIALEKGGTITGRVTGPEGQPLSGVTARLTLTAQERAMPMSPMLAGGAATSDASGRYELGAVPPGEQTIEFRRDGYVPERRTVEIKGGTTTLDVGLGRGSDVRGVVVTESGAPVAGADVRALSSVQGAGWHSARTDQNGAFELEGLAPGRYRFHARKTGYAGGEIEDVDVSSGQPIRIVMSSGGTIRGRILGLDPSAYPDVRVRAVSSDGAASAPLDSKGSFVIDSAPLGTVRVTAMTQAMFESRTSETKTVELTAGSDVHVDLEFISGSVVSGRVTRNGEPVSGALVSFLPRDPGAGGRGSTNTDSSGRYEIVGLEDGSYEVAVLDLSSFQPWETHYEVRGSSTFDIRIEGARVSGRVVDAESGEPVAEASVSLDQLQEGEQQRRFFGGRRKLTGTDGTFDFSDMPEGRYRLSGEKTGFGHELQELTVGSSAGAPVVLRLYRTDGIILTRMDARDGRPLSGAVWVRDGQGRTVWEGSPSPRGDGSIRIPVTSGSYRVTVFATGYAPVTVNVSAPGNPVRAGLTPGGTLRIVSREEGSRRVRLRTPVGEPLARHLYRRDGIVTIGVGSSTVENLPPGNLMLEILDASGQVVRTIPVTIAEGQITSVDV